MTDEDGTFVARINDDYLYESPDGREAFIVFDKVKELAFVVTDIHGRGQPNNAVGFSSKRLRMIADCLDKLTEESRR